MKSPSGASRSGYARVDYRWFEGYPTVPAGTGAFSPDSSNVPGEKNVNLRIGFLHGGLDVNLFALNLTGEDDGRPDRRSLSVHQRRLQHLQQLRLWEDGGGADAATARSAGCLSLLRYKNE